MSTPNSRPHTKSSWEKLRPRVTDELLGNITRRIVARFHPEKIILFGSHAWGKPHVYSDLDLLVLMDSEKAMVDRMVDVSGEAEVRFLPMDVLVVTPAELRARLELGDSFYHNILNRGRILYERGTA